MTPLEIILATNRSMKQSGRSLPPSVLSIFHVILTLNEIAGNRHSAVLNDIEVTMATATPLFWVSFFICFVFRLVLRRVQSFAILRSRKGRTINVIIRSCQWRSRLRLCTDRSAHYMSFNL